VRDPDRQLLLCVFNDKLATQVLFRGNSMKSYQVTNISCSSCKTVFAGYLKEHLLANIVYTVDCPECNKENIIDRIVGYTEVPVPENAPIITEKQHINS